MKTDRDFSTGWDFERQMSPPAFSRKKKRKFPLAILEVEAAMTNLCVITTRNRSFSFSILKLVWLTSKHHLKSYQCTGMRHDSMSIFKKSPVRMCYQFNYVINKKTINDM